MLIEQLPTTLTGWMMIMFTGFIWLMVMLTLGLACFWFGEQIASRYNDGDNLRYPIFGFIFGAFILFPALYILLSSF